MSKEKTKKECIEVEQNCGNTQPNEKFEQLKIIYEFQFNSLKEASTVLEKSISFYLLIIAALTGFILSNTATIDDNIQRLLILGTIVTTFLVGICLFYIARGIYIGLKDLKETMKNATYLVWSKSSIEKYLNRGTKTSFLIGVSGTILMAVIFVFYSYLFYTKVWLE